jgi:hypothetical protein
VRLRRKTMTTEPRILVDVLPGVIADLEWDEQDGIHVRRGKPGWSWAVYSDQLLSIFGDAENEDDALRDGLKRAREMKASCES